MRKNKNKKKILLIIATLSVLLLWQTTSCHNESLNEAPGKKGTILFSLRIPRTLDAGDSLPAQNNTNRYEIIIYNASSKISTMITPTELAGGTLSISMDAGQWTVLVLAGYTSSSSGVLLGSGKAENVTVIENQITEVSVTLSSISHTLTVPESVPCMENFTVSLAGNTNNSLLHPSLEGSTQRQKTYIKYGNSSQSFYMTCSASGSEWSGTLTLAAQALPQSTQIRLYGSRIKLIDPAFSIDEELKDFGSIDWLWPNKSCIPDPLLAEVERDISFIEPATGMGVSINWD